MSTHRAQMTLFDRFRKAPALRVVFLIAALLASQSSLACAFEGVFAGGQTDVSIVAPDPVQADTGNGCCNLCLNCTNCGGCCSFAVSLRASDTRLSLASIAYANLGLATAAPTLWTPPTLLKPPIDAA
jgi:hypothetical protein